MGMAVMTLSLDAYRFRNDDGTQATATWAAPLDAPLTLDATSNSPFRLRTLIQEIGGSNGSPIFVLQYGLNGGGWVGVQNAGTEGHPVLYRPTPNLTHLSSTTKQLDAGSGSFSSGYVQTSTSSSSGSIGSGDNLESEFSLQLVPDMLSDGDVLTFRLSEITAGAPIQATTPTLTATKAPTGPPEGSVFQGWTGAAWEEGTLKRWDGSEWVPAIVTRWTGQEWKEV